METTLVRKILNSLQVNIIILIIYKKMVYVYLTRKIVNCEKKATLPNNDLISHENYFPRFKCSRIYDQRLISSLLH